MYVPLKTLLQDCSGANTLSNAEYLLCFANGAFAGRQMFRNTSVSYGVTRQRVPFETPDFPVSMKKAQAVLARSLWRAERNWGCSALGAQEAVPTSGSRAGT